LKIPRVRSAAKSEMLTGGCPSRRAPAALVWCEAAIVSGFPDLMLHYESRGEDILQERVSAIIERVPDALKRILPEASMA
jgi:hypothetical protein